MGYIGIICLNISCKIEVETDRINMMQHYPMNQNRMILSAVSVFVALLSIKPVNDIAAKYDKFMTSLMMSGKLLTAFSRMDDSNRAYLSMKDYVNFLMAFWEETDKVYDGHSVTISLFGTGMDASITWATERSILCN